MTKKSAQALVRELQDLIYDRLTNERKRSFMSFLNMQSHHPVEVVRSITQLSEVITTAGAKELKERLTVIEGNIMVAQTMGNLSHDQADSALAILDKISDELKVG